LSFADVFVLIVVAIVLARRHERGAPPPEH
jgi:hypothetical protein